MYIDTSYRYIISFCHAFFTNESPSSVSLALGSVPPFRVLVYARPIFPISTPARSIFFDQDWEWYFKIDKAKPGATVARIFFAHG